MKKLVCLLLVALLATVCLVGVAGCGDNEFVEVYSVSYGDTTITSKAVVDYDSTLISIAEDEYNAFPETHKFHSALLYDYLSITKNNRKLEISTGDYIASYYYAGWGNDIKAYYKHLIRNIDYDIVNVKIISDREYLVKTSSGTERIASDNVVITYFND